MEVFGISVSHAYLFIFILSGLLTILFLCFGEFLDILRDIPVFLNPALILAFLTFTSALAYLLEMLTLLRSFSILIISLSSAFILTGILYFLVFKRNRKNN